MAGRAPPPRGRKAKVLSQTLKIVLSFIRPDKRPFTMIARHDFTYVEWSMLLQIHRRETVSLTDEMGRRFHELGVLDDLAEGLSAAGRRLVEYELLMERRNRLQR